MKRMDLTINVIPQIACIFLLLLFSAACSNQNSIDTDTVLYECEPTYYAMEIDGHTCGYIEVSDSRVIIDDREYNMQHGVINVKLSLLERGVDIHADLVYLLDTNNLNIQKLIYDTRQGRSQYHQEVWIEDGRIFFKSESYPEGQDLGPAEGVIIDNLLYSNFIIRDFVKDTLASTTYMILNQDRGFVEEWLYESLGYEQVQIKGEKYNTIKLETVSIDRGLKNIVWVDTLTGLNIRIDSPGSLKNIFLTGPEVVNMISYANIDDVIFYTVNKYIPDFRELSFIKVRAKIRSEGNIITAESLNIPGQKFTGTVEDNVIDGVFEISHSRYNGENAPAFPMDYNDQEHLKHYLKPEWMIESEEAVLIDKAGYITTGAPDSWDAIIRLSRWVSDNISGAIPGGGSALGTFRQKEGECGGHSRLLTALCRGVGIPARMVMGGMYVPDRGGFFGQHAWVEVYMGAENGWIPVDATIEEIDYIDSGHIRLGEKTSFAPEKVDILEYKTGWD